MRINRNILCNAFVIAVLLSFAAFTTGRTAPLADGHGCNGNQQWDQGSQQCKDKGSPGGDNNGGNQGNNDHGCPQGQQWDNGSHGCKGGDNHGGDNHGGDQKGNECGSNQSWDQGSHSCQNNGPSDSDYAKKQRQKRLLPATGGDTATAGGILVGLGALIGGTVFFVNRRKHI